MVCLAQEPPQRIPERKNKENRDLVSQNPQIFLACGAASRSLRLTITRAGVLAVVHLVATPFRITTPLHGTLLTVLEMLGSRSRHWLRMMLLKRFGAPPRDWIHVCEEQLNYYVDQNCRAPTRVAGACIGIRSARCAAPRHFRCCSCTSSAASAFHHAAAGQ